MSGLHEGQTPSSLFGYRAPENTANTSAAAKRAEILKVLDRDSLNLGDINPLIHSVNLTSRESVDAVRLVILEKIEKYGGQMPEILESTIVYDSLSEKADLRFVARFEVTHLNENQLCLLEELVQQTYGMTVRTRKDSKGNDIPTESYPPTQRGAEARSKTGGWYMGPDTSPTTGLHTGLFVFKDLGQVNKDNFLKNRKASTKFIIEVREAGQYQTDLVTFVTQVAAVLGQEKLLDQGELLYETYYDLMRLGLKKVDAKVIYGMDAVIDMIKRGLLTPLASPDLSHGIHADPESVLMIGVPGTGKTLVVEKLLNEDTGLFILPLDPLELKKELFKAKNQQVLLPRLAEVARITKKRVILHVDDVENIIEGDDDTHSTMLNLMAGVKESGFYVIASTNKPEKIDSALLQPQRFGILIHCGLQNEQARYEILKIHADVQSERLKHPLFYSDEIRDIILKKVVEATDYYTPRYLAAIARVAKTYLEDRVAKKSGTNIGLMEEQLAGETFEVSDWDQALSEVSSRYDKNQTKLDDEKLKALVDKYAKGTIGFTTSDRLQHSRTFSRDIYDRVEELKAKKK